MIDPVRVTRLTIENAASVAALLLTTEAVVAEELIAQPGAIIAPGFGDLAEGLARPSSPVCSRAHDGGQTPCFIPLHDGVDPFGSRPDTGATSPWLGWPP